MSRVHDAMRRIENKSTSAKAPDSALSNLVGALLEELADEVPDDPRLETVRVDLLAAASSYQSGDKKDLAMRFYLATRSLLREYEELEASTKSVQPVGNQPSEHMHGDNPPPPPMPQQNNPY
jgi:hypothetical protein